MRGKRVFAALLVILGLLAGALGLTVYRAVGTFTVAIPESIGGSQPGALVQVQRTGKYPRFAAQYILDTVNLPDPVKVEQGVTLYRVQYRTTNHDGAIVVASSLLALPNGGDLNSVVIYFHGTSAQRLRAPSQPGLGEGVLIASAVAGLGHVLVAPDYIGLGESRAMHPYLHTKTTVATSVDCLRAVRALVEYLRGKCPDSLYLMGFSQGGHAVFAVQRELELAAEPQFQVKASAPIAGPFHLRDVSFPQALTGQTSSHSLYLAYLANSYAHIYRHPLNSLLNSRYAEMVPVLFDGDHENISESLPADPRDLFNPDFLDAYDSGEPHWFLTALAENSVDDWTPRAPVRAYYGEQDIDVLPEEALRAAQSMQIRGADIRAISVGDYDHDASALHAIPQALKWFRELSGQQQKDQPPND